MVRHPHSPKDVYLKYRLRLFDRGFFSSGNQSKTCIVDKQVKVSASP